MKLDYVHYAFMGVVVIAALAFAWAGKIDTAVAFGIAGSLTGIAIPTSTSAGQAEQPAPQPGVFPPPPGAGVTIVGGPGPANG